jgi:hypothetical protein
VRGGPQAPSKSLRPRDGTGTQVLGRAERTFSTSLSSAQNQTTRAGPWRVFESRGRGCFSKIKTEKGTPEAPLCARKHFPDRRGGVVLCSSSVGLRCAREHVANGLGVKQRPTQSRSVGPSISDAVGAHKFPTDWRLTVRRVGREKRVSLMRSRNGAAGPLWIMGGGPGRGAPRVRRISNTRPLVAPQHTAASCAKSCHAPFRPVAWLM